jgi:hypothetical protein
MHTFSVPVSESAKRYAKKEKALDELPIGVAELSWDPHEDNLIVSLMDGSMGMITF